MNKFKQCTYTVILLLTCIVASPMIFKQIWTSSAEKKKETPKKTVELDLNQNGAELPTEAGQAPPEQPAAPDTLATTLPVMTVTDINGSVTEITTTTTAAAPAQPEVNFVKSDFSYFDDALFIGDSRTVGIQDWGSLGNADFFCNVGLNTQTASSSSVDGELSSMLNSNNYGKVYIMLGINEVGNDFSGTFNNYKKLVENVRAKAPNAIIYLQANLHVASFAEDGSINNDRINTLNSMIQSLADNKNIYYLDINPVFDDDYGCLREDCTEDGVHVFGVYYPSWCDWYALHTIQKQPTAPLQPLTEAQPEEDQ